MLKRRIIKRILISTGALFALLLLYLMPRNYDITPKSVYTYESNTVKTSNVFLMNDSNLVSRTSVVINNDSTVDRAYELLDILIKDGKGESLIPNGFRSIIPSDTTVLGIDFNNNILKVNFSNDFLDINKEVVLPMLESIIYTLTEIDDVKGIVIYIDGNPLLKLPQTNIVLPSLLDRNFGINKEYDITSLSNITHVTEYYISKYNDNYYYVPVTKYVNDDRDKIKIIVDDLTSNKVYNTDLMSFLNSNTELLNMEIENNVMTLTFNNYILSDFDKKDILEEVVYTICLSVKDNYDVDTVVFNVDNQEIYKTVLKTIE